MGDADRNRKHWRTKCDGRLVRDVEVIMITRSPVGRSYVIIHTRMNAHAIQTVTF